jgi:uncharacterized protein (TIRG00374 family)
MHVENKRSIWSYLIGAILFALLIVFLLRNWIEVKGAVERLQSVQPQWLALAFGAVALGFVCAGQVYGRVLATLGFRESAPWLTATALVTVLINHAIPAGSVALVATLELLSWNGAVLLLFSYGVGYLILSGAIVTPQTYYVSVTTALVILMVLLFVISRPHVTLHSWAQNIKHIADRVFGVVWTDEEVLQVVDEVVANRRLILEQPLRMLLLVVLQLSMFVCHSAALLAILHSLGADPAPLAVLAAYGLALIASTFVILPGGGGAVEAALTLSLGAQGVPGGAALSAALLFRLLSFWLLLPIGLILYRYLTRVQRLEVDPE